MSFHESVELGACDDILAAQDAIKECVAVLIEQMYGKLNGANRRELEAIIAAANRTQGYALQLREPISEAYQEKRNNPLRRVAGE